MKKRFSKFAVRKKRPAKKVEVVAPVSVPSETETANAPRITNDTVAEHRQRILKGARKYVYPMQLSKYRIILLSTGISVAFALTFFAYCLVGLYRFQQTSTFIYKITQVVPFPVARTGATFVSYENYLFELRHYMHYYETQQKLDFKSDAGGKQQLAEFKKRALEKVVNDAFVKKIATKQAITVSDKEVDAQISIVRSQNRLGTSDRVLEDVLRDYWGWSLNDFKRSLRQQILSQKVVAALDTQTRSRADEAGRQLASGKDFAQLAKEVSDDTLTKDRGGEFVGLVDRTSRDVTAEEADALYALQPGQTSGIIDVGDGLVIVKCLEKNGEKLRAAHIRFNFKDINTYTTDLKDSQKTRLYVKV
jgi:hypothetical protein